MATDHLSSAIGLASFLKSRTTAPERGEAARARQCRRLAARMLAYSKYKYAKDLRREDSGFEFLACRLAPLLATSRGSRRLASQRQGGSSRRREFRDLEAGKSSAQPSQASSSRRREFRDLEADFYFRSRGRYADVAGGANSETLRRILHLAVRPKRVRSRRRESETLRRSFR